MRTLLAVFLTVFLFSGSSAEPLAPHPYIGLFVDGDHSCWCASGSVPYDIELWFWVLPGANGFSSVSFNLAYPASAVQGAYIEHPDLYHPPTKCRPPCPDYRFIFLSCRTDWVWLYHETITVLSSDPFELAMHPFPPDSAAITAYDCDDEPEAAITFSSVYLNRGPGDPLCSGTAVESVTWGAVKALFR